MGIDARMFVRVRGEDRLTEERVRRLGYELASNVGTDALFVSKQFNHRPLSIIQPTVRDDEYDEQDGPVGRIAWIQDGPAIIAEPDEQFIEVSLGTRYYDDTLEPATYVRMP